MIPSKAEFARQLRLADWTACMSDSYSVGLAHEARLREFGEIAQKGGRDYQRLLDLARRFEGQFTWATYACFSDEEILKYTGIPRAMRWEQGWRWAGAYLWVHGVRLQEEEVQKLVHPMGHKEGLDGIPLWDKIEKMIGA